MNEDAIKVFEQDVSKEYKQRLGAAMEPLLKYIRFPHLFVKILKAIEDENFIPRSYITEVVLRFLFCLSCFIILVFYS